MKPGIVLASGGIDSVVLMYLLKKRKALKGVFTVNYGQASAKEQISCLKFHAKKLKTSLYVEELYIPSYMVGGGHIMSGRPKSKMKDPYESMKLRTKGQQKKWLADVWDYMPARNTLFLIYALAYARSLKVDVVYTGFQFDKAEWQDFHKSMTYTSSGIDTTPGYVWSFNELISDGAFDRDLRIEAPFLDKQQDKATIIRLGRKLGVDLSKTYSCEFYPRCGACRGCLVRKQLLTSQEENVR
jgi:7-cyano-7-deazaguanine synthase